MPARMQGNQREGAGWPEFAGSELMAAAGVRARLGMGMWGTAERTAGCYGLQVMC